MGLHAKIDLLPKRGEDALTPEESSTLLGKLNAALSEAFDGLGFTIEYDVALTRNADTPAEFRDQLAFIYTGSFKRKPEEARGAQA